MTSPVAARTSGDAKIRRVPIAAASAIALAVAAVGVTAATAGETPPPSDPTSTAAAAAMQDVAAALDREPQRVDPDAAPGGAATPGWLRRSAGELPAEAATAYLLAARTVHAVAPDCAVTAPLLAGLGRVVSDHGRLAGAPERGPARPDTDGGRLDHDPRTDRPVGPMRMLPATWAAAGVDADGDGVRDPRDADDAALAAAVYLCAAADSGSPAERLDLALGAWDGTPGFAAAVRRLARAYAGEDYDAVWDAGRAAPVDPRAYAVVRVARSLRSDDLRVLTRSARPTSGARLVATVGGVTAPKTAPSAGPVLAQPPTPTAAPTTSQGSEPAPTPDPAAAPPATPAESPAESPAGSPAGSPAEPPAEPTTGPTDGPTCEPTPAQTGEPSETPLETPLETPTETPDGAPTVDPTTGAADPCTEPVAG